MRVFFQHDQRFQAAARRAEPAARVYRFVAKQPGWVTRSLLYSLVAVFTVVMLIVLVPVILLAAVIGFALVGFNAAARLVTGKPLARTANRAPRDTGRRNVRVITENR